MDTTFDHVRDILVEMLGVEPEKIKAGSRLVEDLESSGTDLIELTMQVEEQFNIQISDEDFATFHTVGDLVSYIDSHEAS